MAKSYLELIPRTTNGGVLLRTELAATLAELEETIRSGFAPDPARGWAADLRFFESELAEATINPHGPMVHDDYANAWMVQWAVSIGWLSSPATPLAKMLLNGRGAAELVEMVIEREYFAMFDLYGKDEDFTARTGMVESGFHGTWLYRTAVPIP